MSITIQQVEQLLESPETAQLASDLIDARSEAREMRARVDAYSQPILDAAGLVNEYTGKPITELSKAWTAKEGPEDDAFYAALVRANHAHGFAHLGERCPALVKEGLARDAESRLIDHARAVLDLRPIYNLDVRGRLVRLILRHLKLSRPQK